MGDMTVGGRCEYAEPSDEWGQIQCENVGLRIMVRDLSGGLRSIVRCMDHSDWIEAQMEGKS
jgi:hypothetical protein